MTLENYLTILEFDVEFLARSVDLVKDDLKKLEKFFNLPTSSEERRIVEGYFAGVLKALGDNVVTAPQLQGDVQDDAETTKKEE